MVGPGRPQFVLFGLADIYCRKMFNFGAVNKFTRYPIHYSTKAMLEDTAANKTKEIATTTDFQMDCLGNAFNEYGEDHNREDTKRDKVAILGGWLTNKSKNIVSQLSSMDIKNKEGILKSVKADIILLNKQITSDLAMEIRGTRWRFRRCYSPGLEEYVEAICLYQFCKDGSLRSLKELNASIHPLYISPQDYLLGVADVSGELMRLALCNIPCHNEDFVKEILTMVNAIYRKYKLILHQINFSAEFKQKMDTIQQNLVKIEKARRQVGVRELKLLKD